MPTIFSHPAVALSGLPVLKNVKRKTAIVATGFFLTILPDFDVIAFKLGIPYHHILGHRGISHSIFFALAVSSVMVLFFRQKQFLKSLVVWIYLSLCALSHGFLDAMTNGGLGVAFFAPFSEERFFFDYRPIRVSTLNISRFFNGLGIPVIEIELVYIWVPAFFLGSMLLMARKKTVAMIQERSLIRQESNEH